jgi:hypothetical protein
VSEKSVAVFEYAYIGTAYAVGNDSSPGEMYQVVVRGEVVAADIKEAHVAVGARVGKVPDGLVVRAFDPNYNLMR